MNKKTETCHRDFFHDHALKRTPARDRVYHLLEKNPPLTLDQLYRLYLKHHPQHHVSHSTIFRILEHFLEHHIIEKVHLQTEANPLYQLVSKNHQHLLVCKLCKQTIKIDGCPLESYEKTIASKHHFQIVDHQVTLYGLCQSCQKL